MGFLKLFNKTKKELSKISSQQLVVPKNKMDFKNSSNDLIIHDDIKDLIWFANGPKKNYSQSNNSAEHFEISGIRFTIAFSGNSEPSLIDTKLPIRQMDDIKNVERPPYFPTYGGLTPEQRGVYWKLLSNPYNKSIDVGFLFILYYGLERHLLLGDFEKAFNAILKLRDVHNNSSFQIYSGNAIVLSCLYHQRPDKMIEFINSLDKDYELNFSDNLFLLSAYSFDVRLYSKDIIRLAKTFEFENKNYISKYPDLFSTTMNEILMNKFSKDSVMVKDFVKNVDLKKVSNDEMTLFANVSLNGQQIRVPRLNDSFKLKKAMFDVLNETHQTVKVKLAELRKSNSLPKQEIKTSNASKKNILTFDNVAEKELLTNLKNNYKNPIDRHFTYIELQNFYYKFRDVSGDYLEACIKYCKDDITTLNELQKEYIKQETKRVKSLSEMYSKKEMIDQLESANKGFMGNIPAFKRLAIIYEKKKLYTEAIMICNDAIEYYKSLDMNIDEYE